MLEVGEDVEILETENNTLVDIEDTEYEKSLQKYRTDPLYNDFSSEIMEKDGEIGIAINTCYGGFNLSQEFQDAMLKRGVVTEARSVKRTNKILIELLDEGKINPNTRTSNVIIAWIEKKYFEGPGFWNIAEYDGTEWVEKDDRAYNLWKKEQYRANMVKNGKEILASQESDSEKIHQLQQLFNNLI